MALVSNIIAMGIIEPYNTYYKEIIIRNPVQDRLIDLAIASLILGQFLKIFQKAKVIIL